MVLYLSLGIYPNREGDQDSRTDVTLGMEKRNLSHKKKITTLKKILSDVELPTCKTEYDSVA